MVDQSWSGRLRKRKVSGNADAGTSQRNSKCFRKTATAATQTPLGEIVEHTRTSDTTAVLTKSLVSDSEEAFLMGDEWKFTDAVGEYDMHLVAGAIPGVKFLPSSTMAVLETRYKPSLPRLGQSETKAVACMWKVDEEYWVGLFWKKTANRVSVFFSESQQADKIRIANAINTLYTLTGDRNIQGGVVWNGQQEKGNSDSGLPCVISLWRLIFELPNLETCHEELWGHFFVAISNDEDDARHPKAERILPIISRTRMADTKHQTVSTTVVTDAENIASKIDALRLIHQTQENKAVVVMENAAQLQAITSGLVARNGTEDGNTYSAKIAQLDQWILHATPLVEKASLETLSGDTAATLSESLGKAREQYQALRTSYQQVLEKAKATSTIYAPLRPVLTAWLSGLATRLKCARNG